MENLVLSKSMLLFTNYYKKTVIFCYRIYGYLRLMLRYNLEKYTKKLPKVLFAGSSILY